MKIFHCDHCQHLVFFENFRCLSCERLLAYVPDTQDVVSLDAADEMHWKTRDGREYRLCPNYTDHNVCNWAIARDDDHLHCVSCRLTQVIPDLDKPGNRESWFKLEAGKRRLINSLLRLGVPILNRVDDPERGLAFEFKADPDKKDKDAKPVLTGHAHGVITINLAEADDPERERRRVALREPYRTVLGHFRHEVGHYYWDRLILNSDRLDKCRELFGDERVSYAESLKKYYANGPAQDWQQSFVSAYSTMHPWEDWAETWTHYMHINEVLETAAVTGLSMSPKRTNQPTLKAIPLSSIDHPHTFDRMIRAWYPITFLLNNLNRDMGMQDAYPFVLTDPVIEKLRYIHETIVTAPAVLPTEEEEIAAVAQRDEAAAVEAEKKLVSAKA